MSGLMIPNSGNCYSEKEAKSRSHEKPQGDRTRLTQMPQVSSLGVSDTNILRNSAK